MPQSSILRDLPAPREPRPFSNAWRRLSGDVLSASRNTPRWGLTIGPLGGIEGSPGFRALPGEIFEPRSEGTRSPRCWLLRILPRCSSGLEFHHPSGRHERNRLRGALPFPVDGDDQHAAVGEVLGLFGKFLIRQRRIIMDLTPTTRR